MICVVAALVVNYSLHKRSVPFKSTSAAPLWRANHNGMNPRFASQDRGPARPSGLSRLAGRRNETRQETSCFSPEMMMIQPQQHLPLCLALLVTTEWCCNSHQTIDRVAICTQWQL
jgi:hypothetical protein